jgi:hypothetical protein
VTRFKRIGLVRMRCPPETGPEPIVIDVLVLPPGLEAELLARGRKVEGAGIDARFASAEDVILLKLMRDSDMDRADIRAIVSQRAVDPRLPGGLGEEAEAPRPAAAAAASLRAGSSGLLGSCDAAR